MYVSDEMAICVDNFRRVDKEMKRQGRHDIHMPELSTRIMRAITTKDYRQETGLKLQCPATQMEILS